MLSKLSGLAATIGAVMASSDTTTFLQRPEAEVGGVISTGTYPCVFQVGDAFYDYTPFKLAFAAPIAVFPDYTDPTQTSNYIFGWCQQLADIKDTTHDPIACQDMAVFAAVAKGLPTTIDESTHCTAQSSGDSKNIDAN